MSDIKKAIGLTCVDPRMMPEATRTAISEKYKIEKDKIYLQTAPGIVALIADSAASREYIIDQIKKLVDLGHVEEIALCGHQDCKANVVPDEIQREQIKRSVDIFQQAFPGIHCSGIFFEQENKSEYGWKPVWL